MYKLAIEAPWETWSKKLKAMFDDDPEITVSDVFQSDNGMDTDYSVAIQCVNHSKFIALDRLLPRIKEFGNVTLGIDIYDEENVEVNTLELFDTLFAGNPIFDGCKQKTDATGTDWNYVMFKPKVIQFFDDDLGDLNGLWSGIAEDIARDVFSENGRGVFFCTSPVEQTNN